VPQHPSAFLIRYLRLQLASLAQSCSAIALPRVLVRPRQTSFHMQSSVEVEFPFRLDVRETYADEFSSGTDRLTICCFKRHIVTRKSLLQGMSLRLPQRNRHGGDLLHRRCRSGRMVLISDMTAALRALFSYSVCIGCSSGILVSHGLLKCCLFLALVRISNLICAATILSLAASIHWCLQLFLHVFCSALALRLFLACPRQTTFRGVISLMRVYIRCCGLMNFEWHS